MFPFTRSNCDCDVNYNDDNDVIDQEDDKDGEDKKNGGVVLKQCQRILMMEYGE